MKTPPASREGRARSARAVVLTAAAAAALTALAPDPAAATEPLDPIQIITPEDRAVEGRFVTDALEIHVIEGAVHGLRSRILLYREGELLTEAPLELEFAKVERESDEKGRKGRPVSILVSRQPATPERIWREVKPGVYAHLVRVEAKLEDGGGPIVAEEWVRWRTDGRRIEYLDIERYSALVDPAEISTDAAGRPVPVFVGIDRKVEKEPPARRVRFDTRVEEGAVPERMERRRKFEIRNQLDEREED